MTGWRAPAWGTLIRLHGPTTFAAAVYRHAAVAFPLPCKPVSLLLSLHSHAAKPSTRTFQCWVSQH